MSSTFSLGWSDWINANLRQKKSAYEEFKLAYLISLFSAAGSFGSGDVRK